MPTQRSRRRWPRIAPALVVALAAAGLASPMARAPRPAAASPAAVAPRVTGLVRTYGASAYGRVQQAVATCPARKVVLGAGAWITTTAGDGVLTPYALTRAVPYWDGGSGRFACPDTTRQRVLGTGAMVAATSGPETAGPALQVARADAQGVLTRAQAHERPAGWSADWQLYGYAVCADRPAGYEVRTGASPAGPDRFKAATASCSDGTRLVSRGGAVSNVAPGNVALTALNYAYPDVDATRAEASWNSPVDSAHLPAPVDWDFIVAQAICVAR